MLYICSPGNPCGRVISIEMLSQLIEQADKYNFILISDECYSELYFDELRLPVGLLDAAESLGNTDFKNYLVFQSRSKCSNLPELRPDFVAGDAKRIQQLFRYAQPNVTVLSGRYLSRNSAGINPGSNQIRLALVTELDQCRDAAQRIREFIENS